MEIELNNQDGITLKTKGKYCSEDIDITPKLQTKTTTVNGKVTSDNGYVGLKEVTVNVPSSGGGGELNIAYGDTAPEDTSKLWIKSEEPSNISFPVVWKPEQIVEGVTDIGITLPVKRSKISAAAVGTKIYLFGGYDYNVDYRNTIQVFDTTNNTLQTLSTTLQTGVNNAGAAAVGTKIYLFGGDSANYTYKGIQVFDTTNNTIQTLSTTLPYHSKKVSAVTIGDKIYVGGGFSNDGNAYAIVVFDISTNTIQKTINTSYSLQNICIAAVGTKIYLFGGSQYAEGSGTYSNAIRVFDTTNDTIQTLSTTLPEKKAPSNAVTVGTKIYIFGGITGNSHVSMLPVNTIQVFDTTNNTLQTLSTTLPVAAYFMAAAAVGTKIYLFGGQTDNGHFELKNINQFTVNVPLSSNDIIVTQEYYSRTFKVMKAPTEVEVACKYVYKGDQNLAKFIDAYLYDGANWVNVNTGETA